MDRNVNAANRYLLGHEQSAEGACAEAAQLAGVTADQAESCEDMSCGCATCPWKDESTSGKGMVPTLSEATPAELQRLRSLVRRCRDAVAEALNAATVASDSNLPDTRIQFVSTTLTAAARNVELAELEMIAAARDRRHRGVDGSPGRPGSGQR